MAEKRAVVLLSGGLDSAATLAIARNEAFQCYALTCLYGQRHELEVDAAKKVAQAICHFLPSVSQRPVSPEIVSRGCAHGKNSSAQSSVLSDR